MAKMGKRAAAVKYQLEKERKEAKRQEYLSSLSKEERVKFLKEEREEKRKVNKILASLAFIGVQDYLRGGSNNGKNKDSSEIDGD